MSDFWEKPVIPTVMFKNCPIRTSLGVLGKKWSLLILRDIGLLKIQRFNQIKRSLPGLTSRVLQLRLEELSDNGLIRPVLVQEKPKLISWELTQKGKDTIPILMSIISYGSKWYPEIVYDDDLPRSLKDLFPNMPKMLIR